MFAKITGTRGITLVELLVSIVILGTVVSMTTGLLLRVQNLNQRLEKKHWIEEEVNKVATRIEKDIKNCSGFFILTDTSISFPGVDGGSIEYRLAGDSLYVNDKLMTEISVASFRIDFFCGGEDAVARAVMGREGYCEQVHRELSCVDGVLVVLEFIDSTPKSANIPLVKDFFVRLRYKML